MSTIFRRFFACVLCSILLLSAGCGANVPIDGIGETDGRLSGLEPVSDLSGEYLQGYNDFTVSLLKALYVDRQQQIEEDTAQGVFFSPASLYMALGMTAAGMEGTTLTQTMALLGTEDRQQLHEGNRDLQSLLSGNKKAYFKLSNAIWLRDSVQENVLPAFLDINKSYYGALITPHTFDNSLIKEINAWVEKNTDGLIRDFCQPPVSREAFMYLVNTLLFEGQWLNPFEYAFDGTFHGENRDIELPFMRLESGHIPWYSDDEVDAVLLDYQDGRTAMLVAVPKNDLDELIDGFDSQTLSLWLKGMHKESAVVTLPRFSVEYGKELKDVFQGMGITDAFDAEHADFSSMVTDIDSPYIGSIRHKAMLEVGEKGTKAAAATVVEVREGSAAPERCLLADRPFFCAILDQPTGAVLFAGTVSNPQPLES